MLDRPTMITIVIGSCLLSIALLLTGVIICLYFKVIRARKAGAKACAIVPRKKNPAINSQAESAAPVSSATLQLCEECSMYEAYQVLPPCFCVDINEGL